LAVVLDQLAQSRKSTRFQELKQKLADTEPMSADTPATSVEEKQRARTPHFLLGPWLAVRLGVGG
jgi:hypothetical protein